MIFPLTRSFVETLVDSLVHLHDILKTATYSGAGIYNNSPARAILRSRFYSAELRAAARYCATARTENVPGSKGRSRIWARERSVQGADRQPQQVEW